MAKMRFFQITFLIRYIVDFLGHLTENVSFACFAKLVFLGSSS
jgi:hypothetical protein